MSLFGWLRYPPLNPLLGRAGWKGTARLAPQYRLDLVQRKICQPNGVAVGINALDRKRRLRVHVHNGTDVANSRWSHNPWSACDGAVALQSGDADESIYLRVLHDGIFRSA